MRTSISSIHFSRQSSLFCFVAFLGLQDIAYPSCSFAQQKDHFLNYLCVLITLSDSSNTETARQTLCTLCMQRYINNKIQFCYEWHFFLSFLVVLVVCLVWFGFVSRIVPTFVFNPIPLWSGYTKTHWEMHTFLLMLHSTFGYKEIGHLGSKDVKAESALDRYPDVFVLEIEQEQASYEFLLPLCVSQIKSAMRVTSLTIFLSHILFFSCFFHFIFHIFLKGEGSEITI